MLCMLDTLVVVYLLVEPHLILIRFMQRVQRVMWVDINALEVSPVLLATLVAAVVTAAVAEAEVGPQAMLEMVAGVVE